MERERTIEKLGLKSVLLLSGPEGPRSGKTDLRPNYSMVCLRSITVQA